MNLKIETVELISIPPKTRADWLAVCADTDALNAFVNELRAALESDVPENGNGHRAAAPKVKKGGKKKDAPLVGVRGTTGSGTRHYRKREPEPKMPCPECDRPIAQAQLNNHIRKSHPDSAFAKDAN